MCKKKIFVHPVQVTYAIRSYFSNGVHLEDNKTSKETGKNLFASDLAILQLFKFQNFR